MVSLKSLSEAGLLVSGIVSKTYQHDISETLSVYEQPITWMNFITYEPNVREYHAMKTVERGESEAISQ
jgi:hypothetical protein